MYAVLRRVFWEHGTQRGLMLMPESAGHLRIIHEERVKAKISMETKEIVRDDHLSTQPVVKIHSPKLKSRPKAAYDRVRPVVAQPVKAVNLLPHSLWRHLLMAQSRAKALLKRE